MYTHLGSDLGKGAKHPTKKQTNRVKTTSFVCILRVNCVKLVLLQFVTSAMQFYLRAVMSP